jgi:hypothetical protein
MARHEFGGEITHLVVAPDPSNAEALVVAPNTAVVLHETIGGAVADDFMLWDGSGFNTPATSISSDADGYLPRFEGPDGFLVLYDAAGHQLLSTEAGGSGSVATATTTVAGIAELSDDAEALGLTATDKIITPATLGTVLEAFETTIANMPPGSPLYIRWNTTTNTWQYDGATITARPTARTDIVCIFVDADGDSTWPAWALVDVDLGLKVNL